MAFGCLWLPAIAVVITVEGWLGIPQGVQWISLAVVFVLFMAVAFLPVELKR